MSAADGPDPEMKMKAFIRLSLVVAAMASQVPDCAAEVVTWPLAAGTVATDGVWRVAVNGRQLDVLSVPRPTHCLTGDYAQPYYAAFFDADESVEIVVSGRDPLDPGRIRVSPARVDVPPRSDGDGGIVFRAKPPFNLVLERGTRHRALVLAAQTPERNVPRADDPKVVFLGPGRHRLDTPLKLASGETLYLAPGAYVEGSVRGVGNGITVRGRGILSGASWPWCKGPQARMCWLSGTNLTVSGVTFMSSWTWTLVMDGAENVRIDGVKILNGRVLNDDGIDLCGVRRATIRDSFVRAQDDCVAVKWWNEDLLVENCQFWTDVANIIRVGYECAGTGHAFRHQVFRHVDVLHQAVGNNKPPDHNWIENAIAVQMSHDTLAEDLLFEDFSFSGVEPQDLFLCLRTPICRYRGIDIRQGGHVRHVRFRRIHFPANRPLGSLGIWIHSVDSDHAVEDVSFEDCECFTVPVGLRGDVRRISGLPERVSRYVRDALRERRLAEGVDPDRRRRVARHSRGNRAALQHRVLLGFDARRLPHGFFRNLRQGRSGRYADRRRPARRLGRPADHLQVSFGRFCRLTGGW